MKKVCGEIKFSTIYFKTTLWIAHQHNA